MDTVFPSSLAANASLGPPRSRLRRTELAPVLRMRVWLAPALARVTLRLKLVPERARALSLLCWRPDGIGDQATHSTWALFTAQLIPVRSSSRGPQLQQALDAGFLSQIGPQGR